MKFLKKLIVALIIILLLAIAVNFAVGYFLPKDPVQKDLEVIQTVVDMFEDKLTDMGIEKETIDNIIQDIEDYNNETKYLIKFNVVNNINSMFKTDIHLPVSQEIYDNFNIGDIVDKEMLGDYDEFSGLLGDWTITVIDKMIRE